jgi:hypothetical protein
MTSMGSIWKDYVTDLTWDEAQDICESNNWVMDLGYIWDLEIVEDD